MLKSTAPIFLLLAAAAAPAAEPTAENPPGGAFVFEAEHYSETNYGWEVKQDRTCSGGVYIHAKEGIANGPGQINNKIYNFYDIQEGTEFTYLKHHFHLPEDGTYYVYGRMFTTGSHCSNCIVVGVDRGGPSGRGYSYNGVNMSNRTPFRWIWTRAGNAPVTLKAGDHYLHSFLHEDGIRLDQFALSPVPLKGSAIYTPNLVVNQGTAFRKKTGPPVHLTFDLKSMVITPALEPDCRLAVRKLRPSKDTATVLVRIKEAGGNGADLRVARHNMKLSELKELTFLPLDFSKLDLDKLPRREYLLTADMIAGDGRIVAQCRVPLMRPFTWEFYGALPYLRNDEPGPLDADAAPAADAKLKWVPFKDSSWDHFGVMDFGLQTTGNSLHAPEKVTCYARTGITVPATDEYLLKIQSDDQMILWIDGKEVYRHNRQSPVTRSVMRLPLKLEKGPHRLRIRVNNRAFEKQGDGRWQASLRFRTKADLLSNVHGN